MRKKTINDTDVSLGKLEAITDFLPPPDKLVLKKESVKITIALDVDTVDFFKEQARTHHTHYQTMINSLLRQYIERYR